MRVVNNLCNIPVVIDAFQVVCKCSYLEIYNEAVTDLLSDSAAPITIRDDPRRYSNQTVQMVKFNFETF
jgi:hypothetical protein